MHVLICDIKPEKGLIELFVLAEGRQITAVWMPKKYPDRARLVLGHEAGEVGRIRAENRGEPSFCEFGAHRLSPWAYPSAVRFASTRASGNGRSDCTGREGTGLEHAHRGQPARGAKRGS